MTENKIVEEITFILEKTQTDSDIEDVAENLTSPKTLKKSVEEMKNEAELYNVEKPQKKALEESAEEGLALNEAADYAGVPFGSAFEHFRSNDHEINLESESPNEIKRQGERLHRFLKEWERPQEMTGYTPKIRRNLQEFGIEVASKNQAQQRAKRDIQAIQKHPDDPYEWVDNTSQTEIDGSYVSEDEKPAMEDYIEALTKDMKTNEIAETINRLYNREVVTRDQVNEYLSENEDAMFLSTNNFNMNYDDKDDLSRQIGTRAVLEHYHDNFSETIEEVQISRLQRSKKHDYSTTL